MISFRFDDLRKAISREEPKTRKESIQVEYFVFYWSPQICVKSTLYVRSDVKPKWFWIKEIMKMYF